MNSSNPQQRAFKQSVWKTEIFAFTCYWYYWCVSTLLALCNHCKVDKVKSMLSDSTVHRHAFTHTHTPNINTLRWCRWAFISFQPLLPHFSHPSSPSSHHACLPHISQPWSSDFRMLQVHLWLSHWISFADNTLKSATIRLKPPTSWLELHASIPPMDVRGLSIWGIVWYNSATLYDSLFPSELTASDWVWAGVHTNWKLKSYLEKGR